MSFISDLFGGSSSSSSQNADQAIDLADPLNNYQSGLAGNLNSLLTSPDTSSTYGALNGVGAQLGNLVSNPDSVTQTQQYKTALNQGLGATQSTLSAQGLNGSGAQSLALQNQASGQANTAYNTQLNQLSGLYGQNLGAINQQQGNLFTGVGQGTSSAAQALVQLISGAQSSSNSGASSLGNLIGSIF